MALRLISVKNVVCQPANFNHTFGYSRGEALVPGCSSNKNPAGSAHWQGSRCLSTKIAGLRSPHPPHVCYPSIFHPHATCPPQTPAPRPTAPLTALGAGLRLVRPVDRVGAGPEACTFPPPKFCQGQNLRMVLRPRDARQRPADPAESGRDARG